jgi:hypothetical protein
MARAAKGNSRETFPRSYGHRHGRRLRHGASHARAFVAEGANVVIADVIEQESGNISILSTSLTSSDVRADVTARPAPARFVVGMAS